MPRLCALMLCLISAALQTPLAAQLPTLDDPPFQRAAIVVITFDLLAGRCAAGPDFSTENAARVEAWQREHEIALVRKRMQTLDRDTAQHRRLEAMRGRADAQFAYRGREACAAATGMTTLEDSRLAIRAPAMLATLRAAEAAPTPVGGSTTVASGGAETRSAGAPGTTAGAAPRPPAALSAIVSRIDRFGFNSKPGIGYGGMVILKIFPVVLFKDGTALTDVEGLADPGGLDAHRRAHADDWTRWRRVGSEIQLADGNAWKKLDFNNTYSTLPAGFALTGSYHALSGVGTLATGGTASVTLVEEYLFGADGRVVRGRAVGSAAQSTDISVVTSSVPPSQRGRYRIDGITLAIRYDDGSGETRILVTDPADPSVLWLDGTSFTRRRR